MALNDHNLEKIWFVFQNDQLIFLNIESSHTLVSNHSVSAIQSHFIREYHLTEMNGTQIYCAEINTDISLPDHFTILSLRKALELLGEDWFNIAAKAYAIINWDKNHHYCGRCGHQTTHKAKTFERSCDICHLIFYPRISPSVIVLIHRHDEILMARGHHFMPGVYGLIAGFVEPGESIEDAVHRETWEEVRIKIKNLRYYGSQAWPFPDSLMMGFTAEYESGEITIDPIEIEAAGWYQINNLPGRPSSRISIAGKLLDDYLKSKL